MNCDRARLLGTIAVLRRQWRYDWDGFTRDNQPDIPGPMLHVPTTRKVAASGTRFTTAYVPAPVCAPSRSCLASGREYGSDTANGQSGSWSNVLSNGYGTHSLHRSARAVGLVIAAALL